MLVELRKYFPNYTLHIYPPLPPDTQQQVEAITAREKRMQRGEAVREEERRGESMKREEKNREKVFCSNSVTIEPGLSLTCISRVK